MLSKGWLKQGQCPRVLRVGQASQEKAPVEETKSMSSTTAGQLLGFCPPSQSWEKLRSFSEISSDLQQKLERCSDHDSIVQTQTEYLQPLKEAVSELLAVSKKTLRDTTSAVTAALKRREKVEKLRRDAKPTPPPRNTAGPTATIRKNAVAELCSRIEAVGVAMQSCTSQAFDVNVEEPFIVSGLSISKDHQSLAAKLTSFAAEFQTHEQRGSTGRVQRKLRPDEDGVAKILEDVSMLLKKREVHARQQVGDAQAAHEKEKAEAAEVKGPESGVANEVEEGKDGEDDRKVEEEDGGDKAETKNEDEQEKGEEQAGKAAEAKSALFVTSQPLLFAFASHVCTLVVDSQGPAGQGTIRLSASGTRCVFAVLLPTLGQAIVKQFPNILQRHWQDCLARAC